MRHSFSPLRAVNQLQEGGACVGATNEGEAQSALREVVQLRRGEKLPSPPNGKVVRDGWGDDEIPGKASGEPLRDVKWDVWDDGAGRDSLEW